MAAGCRGCDVDHVRGSPDCPATRLDTVLGGKYRLEALVGSGGCGAVYRAKHVVLETPCAVKMLLPKFARNDRLARRFLIEAKAAASLKHPGIVRVTDFGGAEDGAPYLVMELLEGQNLSQVLGRFGGPLPANQVVAVAGAILEALSVAHGAGVIHRDLKPENLILARDDDGRLRPKILDFGLAKVKTGEGEEGLTATGDFIGTLRYASPEQINSSKNVDERSDIYSLGAVVFYLLTGRSPVEGRSASEVLSKVVRGDIERSPAALRADVPAPLDAFVVRALALRREDRFRNAKEMLAALRQGPDLVPTLELRADEGRPTVDERRRWLARIPLGWKVVLSLWLLVAAAWFAILAPRSGRPPALSPASPTVAALRMVPLQGGSFRMGSTEQEIEAAYIWCLELTQGCQRSLYERESPVRVVSLAPFQIDSTEVTNAEFASWLSSQRGLTIEAERRVKQDREFLVDLHPAFSGLVAREGRFEARPGFEAKPVVQVTWQAAQRFCEASGKELPTEAQWEFAARGASGRPFPWGAVKPTCDGVTFGRDEGGPCAPGGRGPRDVGAAPLDLSGEGVRDLGGSVSEWVRDGFLPQYTPCPASGCSDPVEGAGSEDRVCRGGNWGSLAEMVRAAGRGHHKADDVSQQIGFRCVVPGSSVKPAPDA